MTSPSRVGFQLHGSEEVIVVHTRLHRKLPQSETFTERQRGCRGVNVGGVEQAGGGCQANITETKSR